MADVVFRPIPHDLCERVEREAGQLRRASRRSPRVEFVVDWAYVCSPAASPAAVVAALTQSCYDVDDTMWEAVLRQHAPAAIAFLDEHGYRWSQFNEGRTTVEVGNRFARLVNEALDGWELCHLFPYADIMDSIEQTLGDIPIEFAD